jgi:hypothetical protein
MPVARVAKAMGISRQCAHRWVARFDAEGDAGLHDRSSRPHLMPTRTSAEIEARIVAARLEHRRGPDWLGPELGVPARTVSRVLRRHDLPRLCTLDPLTGQPIRATRHTTKRYERERPGELVHVDVKKIGRIPDGGGWRAHGRQMGSTSAAKKATIGYDYVHSAVDDHTRLAYSEILADEKGPTCAGFIARAAALFTAHGIAQIERVITDNHMSYKMSYKLSNDVAIVLAQRKAPGGWQSPRRPRPDSRCRGYRRDRTDAGCARCPVGYWRCLCRRDGLRPAHANHALPVFPNPPAADAGLGRGRRARGPRAHALWPLARGLTRR